MRDEFDDDLVPQSRRRSGRSRSSRRSAPETSQCAIASLILGGLSFPFTCLFLIGPILAIASIILGHVSLSQINHSRGRLAGKGFAYGGLACAYSLLILSLIGGVSLYIMISNEQSRMADANQRRINNSRQHQNTLRQQAREAQQRAMEEHFRPNRSDNDQENNRVQTQRSPIYAHIDRARQSLRDHPERAYHGNSPEAEKIAEYVTVQLSVVKSLVLSTVEEDEESEFRVWCQLSDHRCAILIEATGYQELDDSAKNALKNTAWDISQRGVKDHIDEGKELAVSIHGDDGVHKTFFGLVREGGQAPSTEHKSDLMLVRFFDSKSSMERPKNPIVKSDPFIQRIPKGMNPPPNFGRPPNLGRPPNFGQPPGLQNSFPNRPEIPGFPSRGRKMGRAITDDDLIAPGQKMLAEWGGDQWAVEALAIDQDRIKIHWVGWSEGFQEVKPKTSLFIATDAEIKQAKKHPGSAPTSFRNRDISPVKSMRRVKVGESMFAKISTHWLPVKVIRIENVEKIHVHWESFDEKFDEPVPMSRLGQR